MFMFFDTEFSGLHKDTTLISLGIVTEDGNTFYAEFNDYNKEQCDNWIQENVINNLYGQEKINSLRKTEFNAYVYGNKQQVTEELKLWLQQYKDENIQFVSDVSHYDFILLIDLFGGAFDLPKNVSASCHDINQDLALYLDISDKEAFDINREEFLIDNNYKIVNVNKHNSLFDAYIIKEIYNVVHGLRS